MANKKKKKKPRGKQKGNGFERDVKKMILKAFAPFGITENDAFRSTLSGGHVESYGDISLSSALAKLFPFGPECKFYKKLKLHALFDPWDDILKSSHFKEWWQQACDGVAKCTHLHPLLVFKGNNLEPMCMAYSHSLYSALDTDKNPLKKKGVGFFTIQHPKAGSELYVFKFDVLLKLLVHKAKKGMKANAAIHGK